MRIDTSKKIWIHILRLNEDMEHIRILDSISSETISSRVKAPSYEGDSLSWGFISYVGSMWNEENIYIATKRINIKRYDVTYKET